MSDPVDTDALLRSIRTLVTQYLSVADEVDRLRAKVEDQRRVNRSNLGTMTAEHDRLRAVIENAPHDPDCEQWNLQPQTGRPLTDVCTCWKAGAL